MYKILHFSGGVYRFEQLAEHVEDIGGLLFQENHIHISRGTSFLSEEVQVIFLVPAKETTSVKELASEIKGEIEELEVEEPLKSNLINSMDIYNILCKTDDWTHQEVISEEYHENLEECLDLMLSLELIEKRAINDEASNEKSNYYRILKEDEG
ncbi:methyl-coenzyme M reductase family protein [uncultured Methanobacterium sp.]|uniref:methyl-coenzyme M reductase family protein n=1 Tax=uncultured Methanobacterium sp. TaxID=176306 RepID=UPI002AA7C55F|nr:methyl-coenzyme M reductase family protein [uncultured Methanobacterium sp.]